MCNTLRSGRFTFFFFASPPRTKSYAFFIQRNGRSNHQLSSEFNTKCDLSGKCTRGGFFFIATRGEGGGEEKGGDEETRRKRFSEN